jgi:hypothetical protein
LAGLKRTTRAFLQESKFSRQLSGEKRRRRAKLLQSIRQDKAALSRYKHLLVAD